MIVLCAAPNDGCFFSAPTDGCSIFANPSHWIASIGSQAKSAGLCLLFPTLQLAAQTKMKPSTHFFSVCGRKHQEYTIPVRTYVRTVTSLSCPFSYFEILILAVKVNNGNLLHNILFSYFFLLLFLCCGRREQNRSELTALRRTLDKTLEAAKSRDRESAQVSSR